MSNTSRAQCRLYDDEADRLRRLIHWERTTMQDWLRSLILAELEAAEEAHGGTFPPLPAGRTQLPVGRPLRSTQTPAAETSEARRPS